MCGYNSVAGKEYYRKGEIGSLIDPPCNYVMFMFDGHRTFQIRIKYTSEVMNSAANISIVASLHLSTVLPMGIVTGADNAGTDHVAEANLDVGQMFGIPVEELRPEYQYFNQELSCIVDRIVGDACFCSVIDPENIVHGEVKYTIRNV